MTKRTLIFIAFILFQIGPSWATSGTVTITEKTFGQVKKVTIAFTSDSGGNVNGHYTTIPYDGELLGLATDPGATAPTDNWDLEIRDSDSVDVLFGQGADRDTANTEYVTKSNLGAVAGSTLQIVVTNAGDSKTGTVYLWIR